MRIERAIDTVARFSLWAAYENWAEDGWERNPEISEADFDRVVERMGELLPKDSTLDKFEVAYKVLKDRVTGVVDGIRRATIETAGGLEERCHLRGDKPPHHADDCHCG